MFLNKKCLVTQRGPENIIITWYGVKIDNLSSLFSFTGYQTVKSAKLSQTVLHPFKKILVIVIVN